jgi:hypothetical protein
MPRAVDERPLNEKEKLVDVALVGFRRNEEAYDKMMRRVKPLGFTRRRRSSRRP